MKLESLEIWKRSRALTIDVYRSMNKLSNFGFKDQITRSALSVPSDIADKMAGAYFE